MNAFARPVPTAKGCFLLVKPAKPEEKAINWEIHNDKDMAYEHADVIQRVTGDQCKVYKIGPSAFRIARKDASGKWVD